MIVIIIKNQFGHNSGHKNRDNAQNIVFHESV